MPPYLKLFRMYYSTCVPILVLLEQFEQLVSYFLLCRWTSLKIEEFDFFLTHCTKLTKNHENKFANSIKTFFPNTCKTVCVKAINLQ